MEVLRILIYILSLGGSIFCFINYKKLSRGFLWLGAYLAFAGLAQLIGYLLALKAIPNIDYYNVLIIPYTFLAYFIFYEFASERRIKLWIKIVFAAGLVLILFSLYPALRAHTFSIKSISISSMTIVIGALINLYGKIKNPMHLAPLKMGWLWLFMGFLFYYSSTFSYWVAYNFAQNLFPSSNLALINVFLLVLFYLILITSVLVELKYQGLNKKPVSQKRIKRDKLY